MSFWRNDDVSFRHVFSGMVCLFDLLHIHNFTHFTCEKSCLRCSINDVFQLDILVNNAGRSQRALVEDSPFEVTRQIMELNFLSLVSLTKTVMPHMKQRGGHVVVTSSLAGKIGLSENGLFVIVMISVGIYQWKIAGANVD